MSEIITNSEEKTGLDRRRVVKGVAWSVPIIVTAIAAPAAAASGISATASFVTPGTTITYVRQTSPSTGTNLHGTGPTAVRINNTGSAITGAITGTVSITPVGTVLAGIGVQSMAPALLASPVLANHVYTASLTYSNGVGSGQTVDIPMSFFYEVVTPGPKKGAVYSYTVQATLRMPDGTTRTLTSAGATITF